LKPIVIFSLIKRRIITTSTALMAGLTMRGGDPYH